MPRVTKIGRKFRRLSEQRSLDLQRIAVQLFFSSRLEDPVSSSMYEACNQTVYSAK